MKKLYITLSIMLITLFAQIAKAQVSTDSGTSEFLKVESVSESTDGTYNFKSFEVEASEAGAYYTEFWLLPSKYADNSYSTFLIYLNDSYVGSINPTVGNWQSARVNDHETFNLTEGKNVITIATLAPEFPEVETLRIAKNDEEATFASEPYEAFIEDAAAGDSDGADGVIGGHEYVDLGLPSGTLWATYNVGATSPYEKGDYFAWGEVEPREDFSWENYKFFERYEVDPNNGEWAVLENIGNDISGTEYDAARYQWGNGWRLPNEQERYELRMLCWCNGPTIENGVKGVRIHGPNEHSIFLPVCGFGLWYGQETIFDKTDGAYWTGVEEPQCGYNGRPIEPSMIARALLVDNSGFTGATSMKAQGLNIRAVVNPKESGIDNVISETEKIRLDYRNGYIHIMGCHSEGVISAFDLSGRIVYSGPVIDGICQLPKLVSGIYIVSYTDNKNSTTTQKITI